MARPAPSVDRVVSVLNFLAAHPGESFTLSELATVGPSLRSTLLQPPRGRETKHRVLEARAQPGAR